MEPNSGQLLLPINQDDFAMISDIEKEDVLLAARYGDLDDLKIFISKFGSEPLVDIRDENGNSILHMICGNGHLDALDYLLPLISPSLLSAQNSAKSTPLHWAALNRHLAIVQKLVEHPDGPGIDLIDVKNSAGRSPLGEAELGGWDEGAAWFVKVMNLDSNGAQESIDDASDTVDTLDNVGVSQDIEVVIHDAEGQVGKMKISAGAPETK